MSRKNSQNENQNSPACFGSRLREAFGNIQNKEIATLLGVGDPAISTYLKGRVPAAEKLIEISELTGCSIHWLLTGKGVKQVVYDPAERPGHAKTILFHCSKGGVGTSTAAVMTAIGFAELGYRTLLIDNWYGSCAMMLFYQLLAGESSRRTFGQGKEDLEGRIFFKTPTKGLDLVTYEDRYQNRLKKSKVPNFQMLPLEIERSYSFIVVDGTSHLNPFDPMPLFMASLLRSAKIFIPFQPLNSTMSSVEMTLEYVSLGRGYSEGTEFLGLFVNMYDKIRTLKVAERRELESLTEGKILHAAIPKSDEQLYKMSRTGIENLYRSRSSVARGYRSLVAEIREAIG